LAQATGRQARAVAGRKPLGAYHPTDAKLLHAAINGLNRIAKKHGVRNCRRWRLNCLAWAECPAIIAARLAIRI